MSQKETQQLKEEISDLKEKVEALSRDDTYKSRFSAVIDASPVPFALNDEAQDINYLNPAFTNTFGYTIDDIPTLQHWWPNAYPDQNYRAWVRESWQQRLTEARETGQPFKPIELQITSKDGSIRIVMASAAPLTQGYDGEHLVILYDITERKKIENSMKEQEQELIEIIDHIPSMIFLKEAKELRYVRFNTAGEKLTGITRDEIIGRNDYDFFPKEQADFFTGRDRTVIESGQLEDIPDEPIDTPQGTRSLHTRKVAIHDSDGNPKFLLGISDDITEKKKVEAEHARMQRELQQAHKMESLGHLTGGIAHDFNNLLGIISGFTDLSLTSPTVQGDEKLKDYLQQVQTASNRATNLVSQMLAFSRNDQTENLPIELGPYIKEDIKMLRATLPSTIIINSSIAPDLPQTMMNPTQINQILMNLTVNARDAMDGRGQIDISLALSTDMNTESPISHLSIKGNWIELSVTDNGSGIERDKFEDIFNPFYTEKTVGRGTGMGLAVVYGIMQSCGGHILLDSEVGKGSTFRMLFRPLEESETRNAEVITSNRTNSIGQGENILVVDDEASLTMFISEAIQEYGYIPAPYTDSVQALRDFKAKPESFDLLITDQTMPNLAGLELIDEMRKIKPELPVILCSGFSDKINPEDLREKNIHFFQKPVTAQTLSNGIAKLLYSRKAQS